MPRQPKLAEKRCIPGNENPAPLSPTQVRTLLRSVPHWKATTGGKGIRREWKVRDFLTALDFFQRIGQIAEAEDHHPDLHLEGYRNVAIELSTHSAGGLTENDFIMAAKIDRLRVALKK